MKVRALAATALVLGLAGGCASESADTDTGGGSSDSAIADSGGDDTVNGIDVQPGVDGATAEDSATPDAVDAHSDSSPPQDVGGDAGGAGGVVVLNEVVPNPLATGDDWIELFNPSSTVVDISGWTMTDDDPLHVYEFPGGTKLEPGAYLLLTRGEVGSFEFGLGADDAVFLYSPGSSLESFADWGEGDAPEGTSWGRFPNGTGPFKTLLTPTPGATNLESAAPKCNNDKKEFGEFCDGTDVDGATCKTLGYVGGTLACASDCTALDTSACELAPGSVIINEVLAADAAGGPDWIELENVGGTAVDIGGWALTDSDPLHVATIESGTVLEPGAFVLFVQDEPGSFTFGLGSADGVSLYNISGELTDTTSWSSGQAPAGASWGRLPDGTGAFTTLYSPTPGGTNVANVPAICNNDVVEFGELCDGASVGDATCQSVGFEGGTLACAETCDSYDTSGCTLPTGGIVVNEVTSSGDDQIELFNAGTSTVDISGWQVTDDSPETPDHSYAIPGGTSLAAGAYLVLVKGTDHVFGLGGDDAVRLVDAGGTQVNIADWKTGEAAVSYCRVPNGTGAFKACTVATFGSANIP